MPPRQKKAKKKSTKKKKATKKKPKEASGKQSAPKSKPGRPKKERKPAEFVEGLPSGSSIRTVPLSDIDQADTTFQFRLSYNLGDLEKSLRSEGQQTPVQLLGSNPPYRIIDGFRRIETTQKLGWDDVKAIVREDLSEDEAYALSFTHNVKRKNLGSMDKANAIWQAIHKRGKTEKQVADDLGISEKQVKRYLKLLDLHDDLQDAIKAEKITMKHAAAIHQAKVKKPGEWVARVVEGDWSVPQLKKRLKQAGKLGRPKQIIRREKDGTIHLFRMKITPDMDEKHREKIIEALEEALAVAKGEG